MAVNPYNFWYPVFAIFGIAAITPAMYNWIWPELAKLPPEVQFLGTFLMPLLVLLLGASWLDSGVSS